MTSDVHLCRENSQRNVRKSSTTEWKVAGKKCWNFPFKSLHRKLKSIINLWVDLFPLRLGLLNTHTHTHREPQTSSPPPAHRGLSAFLRTPCRSKVTSCETFPICETLPWCVLACQARQIPERVLLHLPSPRRWINAKSRREEGATNANPFLEDAQTFTLKSWECVQTPRVRVSGDWRACCAECLPPDCELQYPVRPLDEDERLLPAAVERRAVYVDELVADLQLLAQGRLPAILDLETKTPIGLGWKEGKLDGKQKHIEINNKADVGGE